MTGYSKRYKSEVSDLTEWFKSELQSLPLISLTAAEYDAGVDSLKGAYKELTERAGKKWLDERDYELSYNQICMAFFWAAQSLGLLEVKQ